MTAQDNAGLTGWNDLRHGGLLLDAQRQSELAAEPPPPELDPWLQGELRRRIGLLRDEDAGNGSRTRADFIVFVLERVCGFEPGSGSWLRGSQVPVDWSRRALTGENIRPRQLWQGPKSAVLPVFATKDKRLGIGRGRRETSRVLGWLRAGPERLALVSNGRQWRLLFAGLDIEAWCEWDVDLWFADGGPTPALATLRTLVRPSLWTPPEDGADALLLRAVRDSRKGQSELSEALGERVREAVELLIQGHGEALRRDCEAVDPADIYRAACRVVMRMVVILFAEARGLLPRDDAVYHTGYGLGGLHEALQRRAAAGRLHAGSYGAWPRLLALFNLVREGSHHQELPVPAYGGDLFAPGCPDSGDGTSRALAAFETACFQDEVLDDRQVHDLLQRLTRTRVRIRQGKGSRIVSAPVDFSDLSSEYIGVLYEGLLDYELKTAPEDDPVIFLAVGEQPALPLARLEAMDDKAVRRLFEKLRKAADNAAGGADDDSPDTGNEEPEAVAQPAEHEEEPGADEPQDDVLTSDARQVTRSRAESWARRAAQVARLVRTSRRSRSRAGSDPEQELRKRARQLVSRVVLPGEWYLVRWGGTRKGSGSFYTRPGLAVPTVQRTLRPLAWDPPVGNDGKPDRNAPPALWTPKAPEDILNLKVCDPACGSGSFPLAALRFLTDALYASLQHHGRIERQDNRALVRLLGLEPTGAADSDAAAPVEQPGDELIPCPPEADDFEPRLRAVLRRYVVERCIYGVDVDPLAVSLCQLSLWIETMDRDLPFSFLDHKIRCGNSLIGAWFDQFQHYPAMAWKNREAGDKNHSNGVHHEKGARTKAIKAFRNDTLKPELHQLLEGRTLFQDDLLEQAVKVHRSALDSLERMHRLPVQDAASRARLYREELLGSGPWRALKDALDLWCACWFWPADELDAAPLPTTFATPSSGTREVASRVAASMRFFHWELEFPDVFRAPGSGFDAILGNPPWDTAKPKSQEFFSNIDPLYRSYGKQEALRRQRDWFIQNEVHERDWLAYNARFRAQSNFVKYAAAPFGDPEETDKSQDGFAVARGKANARLHTRWRKARSRSHGYADARHAFRRQGSADLNLYKLFLEQAHALLRDGGRLGFVVPSGLYSDQGTGALRELFLEHCSWEWLFGFENRLGVFPIHRSQKFNPAIVEKGGATAAIRCAFMRRDLADWERAEDLAVPYSREQVLRFSPKSRSVLEIESARDLEILEKIYTNSILLGDDGPNGWGIRYATEFHMTNDSTLFPPRPRWEEKGYRPDEYSRWLLGNWRPIKELWPELGIDPGSPEPAAVELEDWLVDPDVDAERRQAERTFIHGHLLAPGDVEVTGWQIRCAQPPYDRLPVPRIAIPEGVILSREADAWIRETEIRDVALPLYEGRMIGQFDYSQKGWVRGKGRAAVWRDIPWERKQIEPQYLMAEKDYRRGVAKPDAPKLLHMRIASGTNERTAVGAFCRGAPSGDTAAALYGRTTSDILILTCLLDSIAFDSVTRSRLAGLHFDYHVLEQNAVPRPSHLLEALLPPATALMLTSPIVAPSSLLLAGATGGAQSAATGLLRPLVTDDSSSRRTDLSPAATSELSERHRPPLQHEQPHSALTQHERLRCRVIVDALATALFGLDGSDFRSILADCDHPVSVSRGRASSRLRAKAFWRVDKQRRPELRHTVLAQVVFTDLQRDIKVADGNREAGIRSFLARNHGKGWLIPETLRLADYGLGHDDRAKEHQPVAAELGPRFYDWQLVQPAEEALAETHLHTRNLLGEHGYRRLCADLERRNEDQQAGPSSTFRSEVAEDRRNRGNWLSRSKPETGTDDPGRPPNPNQADLFD